MKKYLIALITFLTCGFLSAASLKDYVCLVEPQMPEKTKEFLTSYKDSLKADGYSDYADYIEAYLEGSFGSGFIVYGSNKKPYIITNRHVIREADTVNIKFEGKGGKYEEFNGLKIVASDEDMDFALIALPDNFNRPGLEFSTAEVEDGSEVWSAGFPGLGSKPLWQFGNGIVSNSEVRLEELYDPEISTLIQHSAQIDGGNSGGPLLIKDSKAAAGYKVIGINTWKAVHRENTNFAIPSAVVKTFIERAVSQGNKTSDFSKRLEKFVNTVNNEEATYEEMSHFISNEFISVCGEDAFIWVLRNCSESTRDTVIRVFAYDPIDGMRYAIAVRVYKRFYGSKSKLLEYTCGEPSLEENTYKVSFDFSGKSVGSSWIEEQGYWRLNDFDSMVSNAGKEAAKELSLRFPYTAAFTLNIYKPQPTEKFDVGAQLTFGANYFMFGTMFNVQKLDSYYSDLVVSGGALFRLQFPVNCKVLYLVPYVEGRGGFQMNMGDFDAGGFFIGGAAGLDLVFGKISSGFTPALGASYVITKCGDDVSQKFGVGLSLYM